MPTRESFNLMVKYMLYFSSYHTNIPNIDAKIKENITKSGSAENIAYWNWTPEQKHLLEDHIPRMILTSLWSTGKSRIMIEKAKMLSDSGQKIMFFIASQECVLFYHSVKNELKLYTNIEVVAISGLDSNELIRKIQSQPGVHVFIDEFSLDVAYKRRQMKTIDIIHSLMKTDKFRLDRYLWIAVSKYARITKQDVEDKDFFEKWLSYMRHQGFYLPKLIYPLRNTKGQLISKGLFGVFNSPKKPEKCLPQ